MGDPTRITQLLSNLIGNAFKFTEQGYIQLRVSKTTRDDCEWLHCEVSDSGVGLTESQRKLLFTAFSQADSSINRRYGGTGLGMHLVYNLVNQTLQGSIQLQQASQGCAFMITIPSKIEETAISINT